MLSYIPQHACVTVSGREDSKDRLDSHLGCSSNSLTCESFIFIVLEQFSAQLATMLIDNMLKRLLSSEADSCVLSAVGVQLCLNYIALSLSGGWGMYVHVRGFRCILCSVDLFVLHIPQCSGCLDSDVKSSSRFFGKH